MRSRGFAALALLPWIRGRVLPCRYSFVVFSAAATPTKKGSGGREAGPSCTVNEHRPPDLGEPLGPGAVRYLSGGRHPFRYRAAQSASLSWMIHGLWRGARLLCMLRSKAKRPCIEAPSGDLLGSHHMYVSTVEEPP